jgi:hypothetical protein
VHVVIYRVTGNDQPYVRHVQDRGVVSVRVPDVHGDERVAFKLEERTI